MPIAWRILAIILAGTSFIAMHEAGHWAAAAAFDLKPALVWESSGNGLLWLSLGIMHNQATELQQMVILLAATLLPLLVVVLASGIAHLTGSRTAALIAGIYILLILLNLVPIPDMEQLDANRIWMAVLPPG